MYNVLFIDVRNASRSIMAEAITNNLAISKGRFRAYSAGSHPAEALNHHALEQIRSAGLAPFGLMTKSWNEFTTEGGAVMDFVFTVCDEPLLQAAPRWPGNPVVAVWPLPDPGSTIGDEAEVRRAYSRAFIYLYNRINILASLPLDNLDRGGLQDRIDELNRNP